MKNSVRRPGPFTGRPAHRAEPTQAQQIEPTDRHPRLQLAEAHPHKERGYNPYDTVAYAKDTRRQNVWQHKPKRN